MEQSVFDLDLQNLKTEYRIVAALERISEAFRVLLWAESKKTGLSPIQIQILIFILFQPAERTTITQLAREFNLTKPTVSDSVKILEQKTLVMRSGRQGGGRGYTLSLSTGGIEVARSCSAFANAMSYPVQLLDNTRRSNLLDSLLDMIRQLHEAGVITTQRMCKTCRFFEPGREQHYCVWMKQRLTVADLRLDCPEHADA